MYQVHCNYSSTNARSFFFNFFIHGLLVIAELLAIHIFTALYFSLKYIQIIVYKPKALRH